ncbi:hypothetical protein N2152v2_009279 [Parachlorella kessleri]
MRRQAAGVARPAKLVCYQQVHRAVSFQSDDCQHESPFSTLLTPQHEEDPSTPSSLLDSAAVWDELQPPLASPLLPPGRAAASTGIGPWGPSLSRSQGYPPSSSNSSTAVGARSLASSAVPLSAIQRDSQVRELEGMVSGFQALNLSLQLRNDELESDLESARSELPAKDLLYQQLQAQFFRVQRQYASSQAELAASREEAARLRGRLRAAEEVLREQRLAV